jgi:hypothetical protein
VLDGLFIMCRCQCQLCRLSQDLVQQGWVKTENLENVIRLLYSSFRFGGDAQMHGQIIETLSHQMYAIGLPFSDQEEEEEAPAA